MGQDGKKYVVADGDAGKKAWSSLEAGGGEETEDLQEVEGTEATAEETATKKKATGKKKKKTKKKTKKKKASSKKAAGKDEL